MLSVNGDEITYIWVIHVLLLTGRTVPATTRVLLLLLLLLQCRLYFRFIVFEPKNI
jgi:hypothetical protein